MISLSKFLSDNLFLLAEVLSPERYIEKIRSTEHLSSGGGGFMKVDNMTLMMFVLNFVEFCFILELIYTSDFHEGRQYFMLMLVLNFAF